jgi:hypothetical protein
MKAEDSQQTMSREIQPKKVDREPWISTGRDFATVSRGPCSQQTMSREFQPKNRQLRLVYRCWNFAGKPPFLATFGAGRRAFQVGIQAQHVVAAT